MSIRFTGNQQQLRRTANLPSASSAFTICGFAKLAVARTSAEAHIVYTQSSTSAETLLFDGATGLDLRGGTNYNVSKTPVVASVTAGAASGSGWFFFSLRGISASVLSASHKPVGSGLLLHQTTTNLSGNAAMDILQLGDTPDFGIPLWLNGHIAHVRVYNRTLSDSELLAESASAAPVSTTNLLSYHSFVGADVASVLAPTSGTGTFSLPSGSPSISSDNPSFVTYTNPTLTLADTLPATGVPVNIVRQSKTIDRAFGIASQRPLTFDQSPLATSTVVALGTVWRFGNFATILSSVTDNRGNTYALTQLETGANDNCFTFMAIAQNVASGDPFTVNANFTTAEFNRISWTIVELQGVTAASLDRLVQSGTTTGVVSTSTASTGVLAQANEIMLGAFGGLVSSVSAPAGWTPLSSVGLENVAGGDWAPAAQISHRTVTSTAAQVFTVGHASGAGRSILATFRLAGSAPTTSAQTITLSPTTLSVSAGQQAFLTATVLENGAAVPGALLTLGMSNGSATAEQIGATNANGQASIRITGVSAGSVTLTATGSGGVSATAALTILAAATNRGTVSELTLYNTTTLNAAMLKSMADSGTPEGFGPFAPFVTGDYTLTRAVLKTKLSTSNGVDARLTSLSFTADVPDVFDSGSSVAVASGGTTVNFGRAFNVPPDVTVTAVSSSAFGVARVSAVTRTGFFVQVVNASNTGIAATINWSALGY